jgi:hypothetical protein
MKTATEVRFEGTKFTAMTVFSHEGAPDHRSLKVNTGTCDTYGDGVVGFVKRHGLKGLVHGAQSRETWYKDITRDEAKERVTSWRRKADGQGLRGKGTYANDGEEFIRY